MAIAIRGSTPGTNSVNGTGAYSVSLTGSRQPQTGDVLLILAGNNFYALSNIATPTVNGSTTGVTSIVDGDVGTNAAHLRAYYYVVTSTGDVTVTETETGTADEEKAMAVYVLSGVNTGNPVDISGAGTTGAGSSSVAPSVTATTSDGYLICAICTDSTTSSAPWTPPGGMTEDYDLDLTGFGGASGAHLQLVTSGATGTKTFTNAGQQHSANVSIVMRTASAAGSSPPFLPGRTLQRRLRHPQRLPLSTTTGPTNYQQSLSGGLSFTGSQTKSTSHLLTGGLGFTGTLTKFTSHALSGGLSFTGSLLKRTSRALAGTLSFTGSLATQAVHFFTQNLSGSLSFTGSLARQTNKSLSGGLSFTGSLLKFTSHLLAGGLSFVGSQTRRIFSGQSSQLSFGGSLTKRTAHALSGGLSFTGSFATQAVHFFTQNLSGSLSFTGSISKQAGKNLTGGLSFAGSISRRIGKALVGGLGFTGSLPKRTAHGLSSVLSFVGSLAASGGSLPPPLGGNVHGPIGNSPGSAAGTPSGNISGDMHGPGGSGEGGAIS